MNELIVEKKDKKKLQIFIHRLLDNTYEVEYMLDRRFVPKYEIFYVSPLNVSFYENGTIQLNFPRNLEKETKMWIIYSFYESEAAESVKELAMRLDLKLWRTDCWIGNRFFEGKKYTIYWDGTTEGDISVLREFLHYE
jgi:hypothetical protein